MTPLFPNALSEHYDAAAGLFVTECISGIDGKPLWIVRPIEGTPMYCAGDSTKAAAVAKWRERDMPRYLASLEREAA